MFLHKLTKRFKCWIILAFLLLMIWYTRQTSESYLEDKNRLSSLNILQPNYADDILYSAQQEYIEDTKYINYSAYDESPLNELEFKIKTRKLFSRFPVEYTHYNNRQRYAMESNCASLPSIFDLKFNNIYWQVLQARSPTDDVNLGQAFLLSSYYDNRELVVNKPVIRIIAVITEGTLYAARYCQLWFPHNKKLVVAKVTSAITMESFKPYLHTYILTCEIPMEYKKYVPGAVSVVENECDNATNILRVIYNLPENGVKEDFAVCIKALDFPFTDMSYYLVEWLELLNIMGVHKVFMYEYDIHPNMSLVLHYYEKIGRVELIPITMPGYRPNLFGQMHEYLKIKTNEKRVYERIPHNDCFYNNMNRYKYIAFFDFDEVIIPRNGKNWKDMMETVITKEKINPKYEPSPWYVFPSGVFTDSFREPFGWSNGIPKHMKMLNNVYRTDITYDYIKNILDTERMLGISNHKQTRCLGNCRRVRVHMEDAYVAHYRKICQSGCDKVVNDTNIWSHKHNLIKRVNDTLRKIKLL